MVASIAAVLFTFGQGVNRLALTQFTLDEHNHLVFGYANVSDATVDYLEQWLNDVATAAENQNMTTSLCDMLGHAFDVIPRPNNNNGDFQKYLAVMIIDGALNLGDNPLTTSDVFKIHGITLAVVTIAALVYEIWDYYRTLAQNTDGEYMLLENAPAILQRVILSTLTGEDTLRQEFEHMHSANVPVVGNPTDNMNEQNQTNDGVGDMAFDHGLSE